MSERFKLLLGESMWKLVSEAGSPLVEAEDVTPFPSTTTPRRAYRLAFADGRVLKGRRFENAVFVQRARRIREVVSELFFPRILAGSENVMLEEWIEGEVLTPGGIEPGLIRECGRQLGALHQLTPPSMEGITPVGLDVAMWMRRTNNNLCALNEGEAITKARASELENLIRSNQPGHAATGIVLRDLCPENLVVDAKGKVFCIDTGSLSIGPIDEDLSRTWHRWPMTSAERDAFVEGYREHGEPTAFIRPPIFWAIVVLMNSARFRLESRPADTAATIRKLDTFLESVNA